MNENEKCDDAYCHCQSEPQAAPTLEKIASASGMWKLTCAKCGCEMIGNEKDVQGESICSDCFIFPNGAPDLSKYAPGLRKMLGIE